MGGDVERPRDLLRTGRAIPCPACGVVMRFTSLTNQRRPTPFFYAEQGNHVLLRQRDQDRVDRLYEASADGKPSLAALTALWRSILDEAPEAPDGGSFGMWAYPSCPNCGEALVYDGGRRDLARRIHEPKIVLVDGAVLVGDDAETTWRIRVRLPDDP